MSLELKAGARFQSAVCDTQVAVVKAGVSDADLRCGGAPMVPLGTDHDSGSAPAAGLDDGTQMGKRYVDADESVEVLCTKPGAGSLSIGDDVLVIKGAKPLPASD